MKNILYLQKKKDFLLWRDIVCLISKKEHLNKEGLIKILKLKASLNKGLSENLQGFSQKLKKQLDLMFVYLLL